MSVKRYDWGGISVVLASDYDALAVELAEAEAFASKHFESYPEHPISVFDHVIDLKARIAALEAALATWKGGIGFECA